MRSLLKECLFLKKARFLSSWKQLFDFLGAATKGWYCGLICTLRPKLNGSFLSGVFDSSSETGSSVNNMKASPNFSAIPAKGILKKCNSNPQLTKLEQRDGFSGLDRGMSEMGGTRARGSQSNHRHKRQPVPTQVVDINKYLKSQVSTKRLICALKKWLRVKKHLTWQGQPRQEHHSRHPDDIWQDEKDVWLKNRDDNWSTAGRETISPPKSLTTLGTENDYMSDVQSTYTDGTSTFRSRSGQSVNNMDPYLANQRQVWLNGPKDQLHFTPLFFIVDSA